MTPSIWQWLHQARDGYFSRRGENGKLVPLCPTTAFPQHRALVMVAKLHQTPLTSAKVIYISLVQIRTSTSHQGIMFRFSPSRRDSTTPAVWKDNRTQSPRYLEKLEASLSQAHTLFKCRIKEQGKRHEKATFWWEVSLMSRSWIIRGRLISRVLASLCSVVRDISFRKAEGVS